MKNNKTKYNSRYEAQKNVNAYAHAYQDEAKARQTQNIFFGKITESGEQFKNSQQFFKFGFHQKMGDPLQIVPERKKGKTKKSWAIYSGRKRIGYVDESLVNEFTARLKKQRYEFFIFDPLAMQFDQIPNLFVAVPKGSKVGAKRLKVIEARHRMAKMKLIGSKFIKACMNV